MRISRRPPSLPGEAAGRKPDLGLAIARLAIEIARKGASDRLCGLGRVTRIRSGNRTEVATKRLATSNLCE